MSNPPGPVKTSYGTRPVNPRPNPIDYQYNYSYRFGDIVRVKESGVDVYYIAQGTTQGRNVNSPTHAQYPKSGTSAWKKVLEYSPTTPYNYVKPASTNHGSYEHIYAVFYEGELYRIKNISTTITGIPPTNTTYWQKIVTSFDYYYQP